MPPQDPQDESLDYSLDADMMDGPSADNTTAADMTPARGAAAPDASVALSSPADSTASFPDSLANAPAADVEAKASALLAMPSTAVPSRPLPGFEWHDIPRQVPTRPLEQDEARRSALDFIGKMLEKADRDDWMYKTPAVFGPPDPLRLREGAGGRSESEETAGGLLRGGSTAPWQDECFNIEHYNVEDSWDGFDATAYTAAAAAAAPERGATSGWGGLHEFARSP
ncbi:hypothetical protein RHOSPDRAFT_27301 [Rhodotorula sp. JG-1b]|nr:hypothetical protein RHOSPDRAFT_27301 [Rhodotorula sp. JG-1b]